MRQVLFLHKTDSLDPAVRSGVERVLAALAARLARGLSSSEGKEATRELEKLFVKFVVPAARRALKSRDERVRQSALQVR